MSEERVELADAVFIEPAFFGFEKNPDGKVRPFTKRAPADPEMYQKQMELIKIDTASGKIQNIELSAAFVKVKDMKTIPGDIHVGLDSKGFGMFQLANKNDLFGYKPGQQVKLYKTVTKNGYNLIVVDK